MEGRNSINCSESVPGDCRARGPQHPLIYMHVAIVTEKDNVTIAFSDMTGQFFFATQSKEQRLGSRFADFREII